MNLLRTIIKWIGRHGWLTLALILATVLGAGYTRVQMNKLRGTLTDPIQRGSIVRAVYGIGTVTAKYNYQIKPGVTTTIRAQFVKEGDVVDKGALLANIDGVIIRAPFAGTVTSLPYNVGENVFVQLPILTLVDLRDRYIVVSMEQQGALRVKKGQKVKLSFDSLRDETFDGIVNAVYSYQSNFLARIDVGALPVEILPGMTADVAIEIESKKDVLVIPVAAIEAGQNLWVKKGDSMPQRVSVKLGIVDKQFAEIISGDVSEGDRLLIRKNQSL